MELCRIHRVPEHAWLFGAVIERIRSMSVRFGGDSAALVNTVWALYAQDSIHLGLWVGLTPQKTVCAHVLGMLSNFDGETVAWINQAEMDEGHTEREFLDAQLAAIDGWVAELNAELKSHGQVIRDVMMQTPWADRAKAWDRAFGFEPVRLIARRKVRG